MQFKIKGGVRWSCDLKCFWFGAHCFFLCVCLFTEEDAHSLPTTSSSARSCLIFKSSHPSRLSNPWSFLLRLARILILYFHRAEQ